MVSIAETMNRASRKMLLALAVLTAAGITSVRADNVRKLTPGEHEALRRSARERERRILFNNDGADAAACGYGTIEPPPDETLIEDFLQIWGPREGSQIDAVFYSTTRGSFGLFSHRTEVGTMRTQKHTPTPEERNPSDLVLRMFEMGTDPLREYVKHCRERDIEIFWSLRMNDNHDASPGRDYLLSDFKLEHPECLFSRPGKPADPGSGYAPGNRGEAMRYGIGWTSVDYGCDKVRDFAYRVIREVAENYDVDGIEMDFFRHLPFFRSTAMGALAGEEEREAMNGLIRRIREMLDEVGKTRGRPILLAARVPDSVGYCRDVGLDIERWADEGLVDIFIMGGEFLLNEWAYSVEFGRGRDVQVYACLTLAALHHMDPRRQSHEGHRGMAREAWAAGIDGVYTFNLFNPDYPIYWEAGSPQTLKGLDSRHFVTRQSGSYIAWEPGDFVRDGNRHVNRRILNRKNPLLVHPGERVEVMLYGLPGPEEISERKMPPTVTCHINAPGMSNTELMAVTFNGRKLEDGEVSGPWLKYGIPSSLLRAGPNRVGIRLSADYVRQAVRSRKPGGPSVAIHDIMVDVRW